MTARVALGRAAPPGRVGSGALGWAVTTVGLFVASLVVGLASTHRIYLSPYQSSEVVRGYFTGHVDAVRVIALLQFASALALLALVGVLCTRIRALAPGSAAPSIAAAGGTVSAGFLALNALVQWVLTQETVNGDPALVHALSFLFFGLGGFGHVAALGLLVGGLTKAGGRVLPGWLLTAGLLVAAIATVSLLTMLIHAATYTIPAGRFLGSIWLVAAALLLPGRLSDVDTLP